MSATYLKTAMLEPDHFITFLPQFVIPTNGKLSLQLTLLGLVFTVQGALPFACSASTARTTFAP